MDASTLSLDQVEDLLFELRVERAKNAKLQREWQGRKRLYEGEIRGLREEDRGKQRVLSRLEGELEEIRGKLHELCLAFQGKEGECDDLQVACQELQAGRCQLEMEVVRVREQNTHFQIVVNSLKKELDVKNKAIETAKQGVTQATQYFIQMLDFQHEKFTNDLDISCERLKI